MAKKLFVETGERDHLSARLLQLSKESTEGKRRVYIPELRLTVFSMLEETTEETRKRYLGNTLTYGKRKKPVEVIEIEDVI